MFYIEKDNKIQLVHTEYEVIEKTQIAREDLWDLPILETDRPIVNFQFADTEEYIKEQAQKEKARIQELFMTRSDFFDGTIMAWGADEDMLKPLIIAMVNRLPLDDRLKLKALNNFKNALNFYRKHALFNMLVNIPIQLTETIQVIITDESLDKYFDEVAKGNKDTAWKYLPQPITIPIETDTTEKPLYDDV